ncbi:saccharopine dehydrogenase NADP-binding domain-containing protein [Verrucomicrobia bacterium]|nr:saccharopine dehydrogenase NADP-binding domain-containing protein [Verrucomicrobiota bacterium]
MGHSVLNIGAGGVGPVVAHRCAAWSELFERIVLASRQIYKCEAIAAELSTFIETRLLNADKVNDTFDLIQELRA